MFRLHGAPAGSLRIGRCGPPRHTPSLQFRKAHCRSNSQCAPTGSLARLDVASSTIRVPPSMRRCSIVPPVSPFTRLVAGRVLRFLPVRGDVAWFCPSRDALASCPDPAAEAPSDGPDLDPPLRVACSTDPLRGRGLHDKLTDRWPRGLRPRRKAKPTGRLRFLSETSFDLVALRRHVHLQRLAPVRPEHLPLAHWLFRVHRAPERSLRVVRLGLPRHTPRWQIPEAHCRLDQQRAPDGALAMLGVASSTIRPAPRMRRCSTVPPLLLFTRLVVPLRPPSAFLVPDSR